jgi:NAD(P)-dependent dehydrogenase (short-subunit alcohol dehydrogenase family)
MTVATVPTLGRRIRPRVAGYFAALEERTMKEIFGLEGQPALVVGGGYGSGRLTAILLTQAGARVAVADIDGERAGSVAAEIGAHAITGDVTTEAGATAVVDEAHDVLGGLTRVANIVGLVQMGAFADTDLAHWEAQLRLNLYSQMLVCHAAGRHMLAEGGGAIAMVASVSGIYGARNQVAYGIAKAGVMSLARTLSDEWAGRGIRVNCVAPDITAVPRLLDAMPLPIDEALARFDAIAVAEGVPMQRFGRAEEIAKPLLFLLSDMSSFMTGQTLVVDGGTMIHFPHATGERQPQAP